MGLEIRRLSKPLVAVVKRTDIRPITSVDTNVGTEVKVQGEPLATAFKCALGIIVLRKRVTYRQQKYLN